MRCETTRESKMENNTQLCHWSKVSEVCGREILSYLNRYPLSTYVSTFYHRHRKSNTSQQTKIAEEGLLTLASE